MKRIKYQNLKIGKLYYFRDVPRPRVIVTYLGHELNGGFQDINVKILWIYNGKSTVSIYKDNLVMPNFVFEEIENEKNI